jgi:hypothetical protein
MRINSVWGLLTACSLWLGCAGATVADSADAAVQQDPLKTDKGLASDGPATLPDQGLALPPDQAIFAKPDIGCPTDCDDGIACTLNSCVGGKCVNEVKPGFCLIAGVCYADGAYDPKPASCSRCNTTKSQAAWSDDSTACADDGIACTAAVCTTGTCTHQLKAGYCLLKDKVCLKDGDADPENPCKICDSATATADVVNKADGAPCPDDGVSCTDDSCSAGTCIHALKTGFCLIDGACHTDAAVNPAAECAQCNAAASPSAWTDKQDGTPCSSDQIACTVDSCQAGVCTHPVAANSCLIAGTCFTTDATNPAAECQHCDAGANPAGWSDKPKGAPCAADALACTTDACDAGKCAHELMPNNCLIDGACYAAGEMKGPGECSNCNPSVASNTWAILANGTPCEDDALSCTTDVCKTGKCTHDVATDKCLVAGACYNADATLSGNTCQICRPSSSITSGTNADGKSCSDGDSSTKVDTCLAGTCRGMLSYQWEWLSSDTSTTMSGVANVPGDGFWAAGQYTDSGGNTAGLLAKLAGSASPSGLLSTSAPLREIHHRVAVGDSGTVAYNDNGNWYVANDIESAVGSQDVRAVWGASAGGAEEHYVAADTTMLRCSTQNGGYSFSCSSLAGVTSSADIVSVFGLLSGTQLGSAWALRGNSFEDIYYLSNPGSSWSYAAPYGCYDLSTAPCGNTSGRFLDLWARAADDVWAVGEQGLVMHFDGTSWQRVTIPSLTTIAQDQYNFRAVYASGDLVMIFGDRNYNSTYHDLIAVHYNRALQTWYSPRLIEWTSYTDTHKDSYRFLDVAGSGLNSIYVVGSIWSSSASEQRALYMVVP